MRIVAAISFWYMLAACTYAAEKPTREAIIAYNDECAANGTQADFIAKFGTDYAGLDLNGIDFSGPHAVGKESNLRGANFHGANLSKSQFGAALLDGASFQAADLRDTSFITASLRGVDLRAALLAGASIRESDLAQVNAPDVDFSATDISGSDFPAAQLQRAKFQGAIAIYWWTNFIDAELAGANLSHLELNGAQFHGADLSGANLSWCELEEEADFTNCNLSQAELDYAVVTHADFRGAQGLTDEQRAELMRLSGRARWERERSVVAFLESVWFPPLFALTLLTGAWAWRYVGKSNAPIVSEAAPQRNQFSLQTLLAGMLLVALMFGVGIWSSFAVYWLVMVIAAFLVIDPCLYGGRERQSARRMLVAATFNSAIIGLLWASVWLLGDFAHPNWLASVRDLLTVFAAASSFIGPIMVLVLTMVWAAGPQGFSRRAACGFTIWQLGLVFAFAWLVLQVLASI